MDISQVTPAGTDEEAYPCCGCDFSYLESFMLLYLVLIIPLAQFLCMVLTQPWPQEKHLRGNIRYFYLPHCFPWWSLLPSIFFCSLISGTPEPEPEPPNSREEEVWTPHKPMPANGSHNCLSGLGKNLCTHHLFFCCSRCNPSHSPPHSTFVYLPSSM